MEDVIVSERTRRGCLASLLTSMSTSDDITADTLIYRSSTLCKDGVMECNIPPLRWSEKKLALNNGVVDADSFAWISLEQSCGR